MQQWTDELPELRADVVVVGSGSAGCPAAIAAARAGARTLLIERDSFLGGTSTAVLDTFYGFYTPGKRPREVVRGIGTEVVESLGRLGRVLFRPNTFGAGTGVTYHPDHLKVVWETMARDSGVTVLLYSMVQGAHVCEGHLDELLVATKAGLKRVSADSFVDCTGDADVATYAGCEVEIAGEVEPGQTATTTFRMCNVDQDRRSELTKAELVQLMSEADVSGQYRLPRHDGSDHVSSVPKMTATIMTRLDGYRTEDRGIVTLTDPFFLSETEMAGRRQALEYVRFLVEKVAGYEHASLAAMSSRLGVRETRRIVGAYRMTREDVLSARQFPDQIGLCGAPIEDHRPGRTTQWHYIPEGRCVGIPYRSLIAPQVDNLLVAGRCFSASHDAHASVRSMGQCIAMGQAAGLAAALCADRRTRVHALDTRMLREHLHKEGAVLDEADVQPVER